MHVIADGEKGKEKWSGYTSPYFQPLIESVRVNEINGILEGRPA